MKLTKINLNQLENIDLNEREMCRLLGGSGGTPGCCQCSCNGPSSTEDNSGANDDGGKTSDPDAQPCCSTPPPPPKPQPKGEYACGGMPVDNC